MKRFCLALDLKNDPHLVAEYEKYHEEVWPEILDSIREAGILDMEIYRTGNRMCMIMQTTDAFSFTEKAKADAADPVVQKWEELMWKYQQAVPSAKPGEKWVLMEKIFALNKE